MFAAYSKSLSGEPLGIDNGNEIFPLNINFNEYQLIMAFATVEVQCWWMPSDQLQESSICCLRNTVSGLKNGVHLLEILTYDY